MQSDGAFPFSGSLVPSQRRNDWKSFYCQGKYFAKDDFRAPPWTWRNVVAGTKRAIPLGVANQGTEFGSYCPLAEQYPASLSICLNLFKRYPWLFISSCWNLFSRTWRCVEALENIGLLGKELLCLLWLWSDSFVPPFQGTYILNMSWINLYTAVSQSGVPFWGQEGPKIKFHISGNKSNLWVDLCLGYNSLKYLCTNCLISI